MIPMVCTLLLSESPSRAPRLSHTPICARQAAAPYSPPNRPPRMPPSQLHVQRIAPPQVGRPVSFLSGPLSGRLVRVQLDELQKANVGRKCGIKDRRPLDPPPVVKLRLFEVANPGTAQETERELVDVTEPISLGFVCFVDLFPFPNPDAAGPTTAQGATGPLHLSSASSSGPSYGHYGEPGGSSSTSLVEAPFPPHTDSRSGSSSHAPLRTETINPSLAGSTASAPPHTPPRPTAADIQPLTEPHAPAPAPASAPAPAPGTAHEAPRPEQVLCYVDGAPIAQDTCCTSAFVGTSFVSMSCTPYRAPAILGIFSDLAVNTTGTFLLRYRAVNILHATAAPRAPRPVLAECWGGPVAVYSANMFPGLQESTDLTKTLSKLGVPVNIRQTERRKRTQDHLAERTQRRLKKAPGPRAGS
ncbi:hypothetical protein DAEQUDRAFT_810404 [Daedalea quercina L-15889]|uniref:Velvet domain-containing protein n=1 Tax=Daedalea quercina L-15889 TaxID=1314783 RepID=A0A165RJ00_9APHY|nr:hypothetical protein DAEQUDRAFT_810404 [Daedalea quercina L-15889]